MTNYLFETGDFGVSETGIHLLRNRFNYRTFEYDQIEELIVDRGHQASRWILSLAIGIFFLLAAFYFIFRMVDYRMNGEDVVHVPVEQVVIPILPLLLGTYGIYNALKTGYILKVAINGKTHSYPIEELKAKSQIGALIKYLGNNDRTKGKLRVNIIHKAV
jgi:hypothetical protein